MALTESVLLSLVAGVVEPAKRATAFGLFDTGFGVAWFVGSALMGVLYQTSIVGLVIFSVLIQLLALVFFTLAGFGHSDPKLNLGTQLVAEGFDAKSGSSWTLNGARHSR